MLLDKIQFKAKLTVVDQLPGPALAIFISELLVKKSQQLRLLICANAQQAQNIYDELVFFAPEQASNVTIFPDWETLAYDNFSPHEDISSQRIELLAKLARMTSGVVLITASNLMQKVAPKNFIGQQSFVLNTGDTLDLTATQNQLQHLGYHHVSEVFSHGEYSVRGSIIDIFPSGAKLPFRIDLFDNEVESIRVFNPDDQLSIEKIATINLLPAKEYPFNDDSITHFKTQWSNVFPEYQAKNCAYYQMVEQQQVFAGIEYFAPLFFAEPMVSLLDYLPSNTQIITTEQVSAITDHYWQEIKERYEQRRHNISQPILPPSALWLRPEELFSAINQFEQIKLTSTTKLGLFNFGQLNLSEITINHRQVNPFNHLLAFQKGQQLRIIICTESLGRKESLKQLLLKANIKFSEQPDWQACLTASRTESIIVTVGTISGSILLATDSLLLLSENDLFGQKITQRRRQKTSPQQEQAQESALVKSIAELNIGDPIVHLEHGIGRYLGLQSMGFGANTQAQQQEFLTIEYSKGDKLYVPITCLHLISRYSSAETQHAPLHSLSSDQWEKSKKKALNKAYDIATELLAIYAQREAFSGESLVCDEQNYAIFADQFPFEETPDQAQAIQAVIADLAKPQPMDRVICGDVGFGKTEVAMRTAFISAMNHKQTAILVPTTLLAEQHGENFINRFADWPIKIAVLSRFKTPKEQKAIIEQMGSGQIDIVIGTHKLLQQDIQFAQLGLLIIDEEHRFGVRQKERLKQLKAKINLLTMTATPIPRTLNMAMAKLREFSIIASPPAKRLSVKTFVSERKRSHITEAIERELHRGGQVFFLHNNVKTIELCAEELRGWLPSSVELRIAHGQMAERELEKIMADFYHRKFSVLVCTTIIETGIDIPTANTIIMDRADRLGLAQLHQLRGRVGRSHHQAYAHLLHPGIKSITSDAKKRLAAIESLGELGAGFSLASHDLEIRGAGELLGEEQSGQMHEVGFSLYLELIDKAVKDLKSGKTPNYDFSFTKESEVDLGIPALLPEDYLPDIHQRLQFYKYISDAQSEQELDQLQIQLIDRFGLLPEPAKNLFALAEFKHLIKPIGIKKLSANQQFIKIDFLEKNSLDPAKIIQLIQTRPHTFKLNNPTQLKIMLLEHPIEQRISKVTEKIQKLLACL